MSLVWPELPLPDDPRAGRCLMFIAEWQDGMCSDKTQAAYDTEELAQAHANRLVATGTHHVVVFEMEDSA
jgi:hypothetical protein